MEIQLINKIKKGNQKAFKSIYEMNAPKLFRFLKQFSSDEFQIDDWIQRAFIKAYENINSFEGNSKFSTWLFTIAINEMRSDFRKENKYSFTGLDLVESTHSSETNEDFEWSYDMKKLMNEIDANKRAIFILYEVEGYSHSEMLQISEVASRTNLFGAKKILREKYLKLQGAV